jgi:dTDP-4-dehydrorhamnose reductase
MAIILEAIKLLGATEKEVVREQYFYGLVEKNVLVTGADGQLGSEIKVLAQKVNTPFKFHFTDADILDISSKDEVEEYVKINNIQYILNCAGYTAVDMAETDSDKAFEVNVTGVENIASVAKQFGVKVIHISTDFVFDGASETAYTEEMTPNPLSVYGSSKLKGEEALMQMSSDWIIIRTSWLFSEFKSNFVKTMISLMKQKDKLTIVEDEVGTPTYAADLAEMIIHILQLSEKDEWKTGLYHFCNRGEVSRLDFAKEIKRLAGIKDCELSGISAKEYGAVAKRPTYSALDPSKIANVFSVKIPSWEDALERCIKKNKHIE